MDPMCVVSYIALLLSAADSFSMSSSILYAEDAVPGDRLFQGSCVCWFQSWAHNLRNESTALPLEDVWQISGIWLSFVRRSPYPNGIRSVSEASPAALDFCGKWKGSCKGGGTETKGRGVSAVPCGGDRGGTGVMQVPSFGGGSSLGISRG